MTSVARSSATDVTNGRGLGELRQRRRGNVQRPRDPYLCRGKLLGEVHQEKSWSRPDARRLAELEGMLDQLRDDIRAVRAGDRAVITRARVLYGRLIRAWYAPAPH